VASPWPGSGRRGEAIAGAAHRLQASGTVTEFVAQGADHDLDDVAAAAPVVAPYVAQQRCPADDPAFAFVQVLKDVEFQLGEIGAGEKLQEVGGAENTSREYLLALARAGGYDPGRERWMASRRRRLTCRTNDAPAGVRPGAWDRGPR
jgi:hypothetical protein